MIPAFVFANVGDQTVPEGAPLRLPILAHTLDNSSFTVSGLPSQFYVDSNGVLTGSFEFYFLEFGVSPSYDATITVYRGSESLSTQFTLTTTPGFSISGVDDRRDWAGATIDSPISVSSPYGHPLSVSVDGLPPGLSIDENLAIHGTIGTPTAIKTTYHVTATVTDETLNYSYPVAFDWTVQRTPTLAELNAGTPAGQPFLAAILDPSTGSYPSALHAITYGSGPAQHTVAYFVVSDVNGAKLWQYDGGVASVVESADASDSSIGNFYYYAYVDGRGVLLSDVDGTIWFVDEQGGHVLDSSGYTIDATTYNVDGVDYVGISKYDSQAGQYVIDILSIEFSPSGPPTAQIVPNSSNFSIVGAFGNGLLVRSYSPTAGWQSVYWFDLATGQTYYLGDPTSQFVDFQIVDAGDGTQNLLYFDVDYSNGGTLYALNSSQLGSGTLTPTDLGHFDYIVNSPMVVDGKYVFAAMTYGVGTNSTAFYQSDGTLAGTAMIGASFTSNGYFPPVYDPVVFGDDLYFVYTPDFDNDITPSTVTARIWRVDVAAGERTVVAEFFGEAFYYYRPAELVAAGDKIMFIAANPATNSPALWSLDPATGETTIVNSHDGNAYQYPNMLTYASGSIYFVANAEGVPDLYGYPTSQVWVLGPEAPGGGPELPGDFNSDGAVDAADYVLLRKTARSPQDYTTWRQNFGSSTVTVANLSSAHVFRRRDAIGTGHRLGRSRDYGNGYVGIFDRRRKFPCRECSGRCTRSVGSRIQRCDGCDKCRSFDEI